MFKPKVTTAITKVLDVPESNATVTIKHIKAGLMQAIVQNSMTVVHEGTGDGGGMVAKIGFNMVKKNRDIVMASITAWSGFFDEEDRPMKYSAMNVAKMIDQSDEFVTFIVESQEKLNADVEAEQEPAEKN